MKTRINIRIRLLAAALSLGAFNSPTNAQPGNLEAQGHAHPPILRGRVVAVGIPGASAISGVGTFLPGGPIHDKPEFAAYTAPGRVIDPTRIVVGSRSNFGAPLADPAQEEGSFLSIDPAGADILVIPPHFAAADGQASALGGRVQMFSANSPAFLNGINTPGAVTAGFTGVSHPLGMSINNAFGRFWPANAPYGLDDIGTSTILDPTGLPLAGAPNPQAGGVFAGDLTPRLPTQLLPGALNSGAVGTALLGRSPDGSGRAVFCVVLADGSIVQEHTEQAVDGLAPAGTVASLRHRQHEHGVTPRLGAVFNYEPTRILHVSEPFEDGIAVIELTDDGVIFRVASVSHIRSRDLNYPVDLAPAEIETEDPDWAGNTTLEEGADFYVANRGNNTIVRMRQDGTVVAERRVLLGVSRLNGIAVSPAGNKIWVTITALGNHFGAVLELPAFGE
ncbi:MAG: hypothetical protein L0Z50_37140 [Verrucomicrobiales bacterium]|nr:hypothetical protein [Verrucomicrobiales bacterium]